MNTATTINSRPHLDRGTFAKAITWDDLMNRHYPIYRDGIGEYTRFCTGTTVYRNYKFLNGMPGIIVDVSKCGQYREVRFQNGETGWVPAEILEQIRFQYDDNGNVVPKPSPVYHDKPCSGRTFRRMREYMKDSVVGR